MTSSMRYQSTDARQNGIYLLNNECHVNENPPHFIHEIKTIGDDVIGVNSFPRKKTRFPANIRKLWSLPHYYCAKIIEINIIERVSFYYANRKYSLLISISVLSEILGLSWSFICSSKYMFYIFTFIYSAFAGLFRTHNMSSSQLAW